LTVIAQCRTRAVVAEEKKYHNGKETALLANFFLRTYWRELQISEDLLLGEFQFNPGIIRVGLR